MSQTVLQQSIQRKRDRIEELNSDRLPETFCNIMRNGQISLAISFLEHEIAEDEKLFPDEKETHRQIWIAMQGSDHGFDQYFNHKYPEHGK